MNKSISLIIMLGILSQLYANIFATTDTNKRVLLKDNGSWVYLETEKKLKKNNPLIYQDKNVQVKVKQVSIVKLYYDYVTQIILDVLSLNQTRIINFNTHTFVSFDDGTESSTLLKYGITLKDNFENDLKISSLKPEYFSTKQKGLRPNQHQKFKIIATDYPLKTSKYIILKIPKNTFGNLKAFEIKILNKTIKIK